MLACLFSTITTRDFLTLKASRNVGFQLDQDKRKSRAHGLCSISRLGYGHWQRMQMSIPIFEMPTPWAMVSPELCLRREPLDEVLSLLVIMSRSNQSTSIVRESLSCIYLLKTTWEASQYTGSPQAASET